MKNVILFTLWIFAIMSFFVWVTIEGIDKDEKRECRKWQEYAAQYEGFYLVQWQADQCNRWEIPVNAPVK